MSWSAPEKYEIVKNTMKHRVILHWLVESFLDEIIYRNYWPK